MNEWLSKPDDLRLARIAAGALNDMAEHFWNGFEKIDPARVSNTPDVKAELAKKSNDWSLVRDVAETHKHVKLSRKRRSVTSAGQTVVIPTGSGTLIPGAGAYGGSPSVVVYLDDGSTVHFIDVAKRAFKMWKKLLA
jgi:hypothetical protein